MVAERLLKPPLNEDGSPFKHGSNIGDDLLRRNLPQVRNLGRIIERELLEPLKARYESGSDFVWHRATHPALYTYSKEEYPIGTPLVLGFRGVPGYMKLGIVVSALSLGKFGLEGCVLAMYHDGTDFGDNLNTRGMIFGA